MKKVIASSFADPADVVAYFAAKSRGLSDVAAFAFGDNGIGCWGDSTSDPARPACALPPDDWKPLGKSARGARVRVKANGRSVICELLDTMPRLANIKNGAGIDLNPAACLALGLTPPVMNPARWEFIKPTLLSRILTYLKK